MKRTVTVNLIVGVVVLGIIASSHTEDQNRLEWILAAFVVLSICMAVLVPFFHRSGRLNGRWVAVLVCGVASYGYGMWFQSYCAPRPLAAEGAQIRVQALVQSVTQKKQYASVQLHVTREGVTERRVSYTAYWTTTQSPLYLTEGDTVTLTGMFVNPSSAENSLQSWLAPTYSFRGKLVEPADINPTTSKMTTFENAVDETVPRASLQDAQLALSMVIGHQASISNAMQTVFLQAGVTHLLAASGANVVLFCRFIEMVWAATFRVCGIRFRWVEYGVMLVAVWGFVGICGFAVPVARAGVLCSYTLLGRFFRRKTNTMSALAISNLLFVAVQPYGFTSVSGLLSFTATFAMARAIHSPGDQKRGQHLDGTSDDATKNACLSWMVRQLRGVVTHVVELLYMSVMIDVFMIPLVWWWFGQLTPYGALATVAVEPFVVVLLPMTIIWCVCAVCALHSSCQLFFWDAQLLGVIVTSTIRYLLVVLTWFASRPYSLTQMPLVPGWMFGLYFSLLLIGQRKWAAQFAFLRMSRR